MNRIGTQGCNIYLYYSGVKYIVVSGVPKVEAAAVVLDLEHHQERRKMSVISRVSAMAASSSMLINSISKRAFPSILLSHHNSLFPSGFSSLSFAPPSTSTSSGYLISLHNSHGEAEIAAKLNCSIPQLVAKPALEDVLKITEVFRKRRERDIGHLAQATKNTVDILLKGVNDKSLVEEIKHILEMANRTSMRREILHTNFLTPPTLNEAMAVLNKLNDVNAISNGGYPEAERCRLSVGHAEILTTLPDTVAALSSTSNASYTTFMAFFVITNFTATSITDFDGGRLEGAGDGREGGSVVRKGMVESGMAWWGFLGGEGGNFGFQPPTHGDFLGSILGTGIAREKLGDIILQGEKGAQILIVPELVDYIISSLTKVGNVPVSCTMVPLEALEYEPPRLKTVKTVESSLRVDAIASAGFKISRSKFSELISKGDVRINWSTVTKNGATLKTGDLVSVSGQGRLKIGEINTTKRGRYAVELMRYL
ncbi:hypothetical protein KSS87_013895 [Heliosperma pusillum]|nr:hypothetical protein KSS87_013895 [Heliosperma pusillum]